MLFEKLCENVSLVSLGDLLNLYDHEKWQFDNEHVAIRFAYFRLSSERQRQLQNRLEQLPLESKERARLQKSLDRWVYQDFMILAAALGWYQTHLHWRAEARARYVCGLGDVLPELINATGIRRCILIGHSDGGSIAIIYAAVIQEAISRINRLTSVSSKVYAVLAGGTAYEHDTFLIAHRS